MLQYVKRWVMQYMERRLRHLRDQDQRQFLPDGNIFKHYAPTPKTPIREGAPGVLSVMTAEEYEARRLVLIEKSL